MPISASLLKNIRDNAPHLTVINETQEQKFSTEDLEELLKALKTNTVVGRIVWDAEMQHDSTLSQAIENRLAENNRHYRDRPSAYEYASLSEHVYENLTQGQLVEWTRQDKKTMHLPDWRVEAIFQDEKNGYYAAAYYHPKQHFLVLAHRGAETNLRSAFNKDAAQDLNTDIDIVYNRITAQQISAYAATEELVKLARENHWRFSMTGHSLGGWLAQITLIHCHLDFNYQEAHAVTFNNPGAAPMLRALNAGNTLDYRLSSHQFDIVTYLSAPNVINTCHEQLGSLYRLFPQEVDISLGNNIHDYLKQYSIPEFVVNQIMARLQSVEIIQWLQTVASHSIIGLVDCFDSQSGAPKRVEYIQKWPQVIWSKENHLIQGLIYQQGRGLKIPDSMSERASQATQSAFQWLGLSAGGLLGWSAGLITGHVTGALVEKALRYTADLQLVQTIELALNYYGGNADKSAYQAFLKFANATNDFHPVLENLELEKRYNLHFKAQYKVLPATTNRVQSRQFHSNEIIQFLHQCKIFCVLLSSLPTFNKEKDLLNLHTVYRLVEGNAIEMIDAALAPEEFRRRTRRYLECFPELNNLSLLLPITLQHLSSQQQKMLQKEAAYVQLKFDTFSKLLANRYKQHDDLLDLFGEQERSIADSYINLALVKEDTLRDEEQRMVDKATKKSEAEDWLHSSTRDVIYAKLQSIELSSLFQQRNEKAQRIMVLGEPGVGKTTLCRYITYQWTQGQLWSGQYKWVFWIQLRHLNQYDKSARNYNWADVVAKELFNRTLTAEENAQFKDFFKTALEQNEVLFLMDGYDEIASQHMDPKWPLKEAIDELLQMRHYLLMSRPHVVAGLRHLTNLAVQITGFTTENVATYIRDFFTTQPEKGKRLQTFLEQNPAVQGIARVPINLQLICSSWREEERQTVPTLTELYDSMLITLLERELNKRNISSKKYLRSGILDKFKLELDALGALALYSLREGQVIILSADIDQLLAGFIKERDPAMLLSDLQQLGLLKPIATKKSSLHSDHYFIHKTFQEFFAGYYVAKLFKSRNPEAKKILATYKYSPALETVWWFTAGLLSMEVNAQSLNTFFTSLVYEEPIDMFGFYSRQLVIRCLDETRVSNKLEGVENYLEWLINKKDLWRLHPKIRNLLMQQLAHSPFVKERTKILDIVLQAFNDPESELEGKAVEALKFVGYGSQAVIATLLHTLNHSEQVAKLQAIRALGFLGQGSSVVVESLLRIARDPVALVRYRIAMALGQLNERSSTVIELLLEFLKDPEAVVRYGATMALGQLGQTSSAVINTLLHVLHDPEPTIREQAVIALRNLGKGSPEVLKGLLRALQDFHTMKEAALALGELTEDSSPAVVEALFYVMYFKPYQDADTAFGEFFDNWKSFGFLESKRILEKNKELAAAAAPAAARALGQLGQKSPTIIETLCKDLKSIEGPSFVVSAWEQMEAVLVSVEPLTYINPTGEGIPSGIILALGHSGQGTPPVIDALLYAAKNLSGRCRASAIQFLGRLGQQNSSAIIEVLLDGLNQRFKPLRVEAIRALGNIGQGSPAIIEALFNSLNSKLENSFMGSSDEIAKALVKLGQKSPAIIEALIAALQDSITTAGIRFADDRKEAAEILRQLSQKNLMVITLLFLGWLNQKNSLAVKTLKLIMGTSRERREVWNVKQSNEIVEILMWLEESNERVVLPRVFYRKNQKIYFYETRSLHPQEIPFTPDEQDSINKFLDQALPELPDQLRLTPQPTIKVVIEDNAPSLMMGSLSDYSEEDTVTSHQRKLLSITDDDNDFADSEECFSPSFQQVSSASRATDQWFSPITDVAQWAFSSIGTKSMSARVANFASGLWASVSNTMPFSAAEEKNEKGAHKVQHGKWVSPMLSGIELAQVGVPVINSLSKVRGWFGYKPLKTQIAAEQKMQYERQLQEMDARLNAMEKHPILRRRTEYRGAQKAFSKAQLRFKNYFQNTSDPHHAVTESENAELIRLTDLAQKALSFAEVLHNQIKDNDPILSETVRALEAEYVQAIKKWRAIKSSFSNTIKTLQNRQERITHQLNVIDIKPAQEIMLSAEWDELDTKIIKMRKAEEQREPAHEAIAYLLKKINEIVESGCLPEQVVSVKEMLALTTAACGEIALETHLPDQGVTAKVIMMVDELRSREDLAYTLFERRNPVKPGFFSPVIQVPVSSGGAIIDVPRISC